MSYSHPHRPVPRSDAGLPGDLDWVKATASNQGGDCVELRRRAGVVELRDSKDPHGPVLRFARHGLATWLDAARTADLDRLARD